MEPAPFSAADREELRARGLTEEAVQAQIALFKQGIPFTVLHRPCTVGDGITVLTAQELAHFATTYAQAALAGRAMKFVPASGAASRMFKLLLSCMNRFERIEERHIAAAAGTDQECQELLHCINHLPQFAFFDDLKAAMAHDGLDLEALRAQGQYTDILAYLLTPQGLNYANLPKALLKFHRYSDHCRTPLEEQLVEAIAYTREHRGLACLHFTMTPAHLDAAQAHLEAVRSRYEQGGVRYEVTFSTQKPSTDTIAVDLDNRLFRDQQGCLVFRPAGHGALLENLHALAGDIVFIKNIDNVVPDHLKEAMYVYKRALGGYLVELQTQIFAYVRRLMHQDVDDELLTQMCAFLRAPLSIEPPAGIEHQPRQACIAYLLSMLNRPLRVCGMVPNAGEPGGGPFWVQHADGSRSAQIVEISQVDLHNDAQRAMVEAATHFNPVDLVCGVRDVQGKPFDLLQFTDPNTGFISVKSYEGRELKALELPGLWNGSMAKWNTVFVEVPLSIFTPVKTVLDLLRPEHQSVGDSEVV
jgi:Domain of unknown function (DUF4301)